MSKIRMATYQLGVLLCLTTGLLLSACSGDSTSDSPVSSDRQIRLTAGAHQFSVDKQEAVSPAATRSVTYPNTTDWEPYDDQSNMLVFMAKSKDNPSSSDVLSRLCSFSSANADWQANVTITDAASKYNIFGFMPIDIENSSDNVSISRLPNQSNYDAGAQMTIRGLKVLTMSDPCVIVGVARQEEKTSDVTLQWGKFDFTFKQNTTGDVTDYMSILVDHIYSRYYFSLKIDADYAQLRTIRVKKMTLEALSDDGTKTLRSVDATVSIRSNTTNTNPVTSVSFSRNTGTRSVTVFDKTTTTNTDYTNGIELSQSKTEFQRAGYCLAPCDQRWFRLTTEYDVYDRTGKHIRTNTAVNSFNTANFKEKPITSTTPGLEHTIQIVVNPTYIYILSDADLDNPPFVVNN